MNFKKLKPTFDFAVIFMIFGVLLDVITTILFVVLDLGFEKNELLARLIDVSIVFVPIYLLIHILIAPFFGVILRKSFAYYFGIRGLLYGLNNLSLIFWNNAFIMDNLGILLSEIIFALIGLSLFAYFSYKHYFGKRELVISAFKA